MEPLQVLLVLVGVVGFVGVNLYIAFGAGRR
jgi:hypothetical protein